MTFLTTYSTYTMYTIPSRRLLYHIATAANTGSGIKIKAIGSWQRKRTKKKDEKQGRKKLIIQYVIIFMLRTFSSNRIYLYRNTSRYTMFCESSLLVSLWSIWNNKMQVVIICNAGLGGCNIELTVREYGLVKD